MHPHMERLYQAAKAAAKLSDAEGQSAVARHLNISPQRVNNWEARGISSEGLLEVQRVFGCNALWIRDGIGAMFTEGAGPDIIISHKADEAATELAYITIVEIKLLTAYRGAEPRERKAIEIAAGIFDALQAAQSFAAGGH